MNLCLNHRPQLAWIYKALDGSNNGPKGKTSPNFVVQLLMLTRVKVKGNTLSAFPVPKEAFVRLAFCF